ncbi:MAG: DUF2271 domain-containing protein [Clostridiales bacterium]|nr:DUF2271 domain-containing protein [Clostridiales bacterium]
MQQSKRIITIVLICLFIMLCACSEGNRQSETTQAGSTEGTSTDGTSSEGASSEGSAAGLATEPSVAPAADDQSSGDSDESVSADPFSGEVVISFDYVGQSGSASNQVAVWIEDMNGAYVQTVYVTRWTADGGFKTRPDSLFLWVEKSGVVSMPSYYVDAVSGATPKTGEVTCVWNLMDINGNRVPPGEYQFFVEGTLRWKNYVLYSGVIEIGDAPTTVEADAAYVYAGSGNQPALTGDSPENAMIGPVTCSYLP